MQQQPSNVTKKELVDQVMQRTGYKRPVVRHIVQDLLDTLVDELAAGRRVELRDFGVFEVKLRAARQAQNPKTLQKVEVPPKQCVKFKPGRLMKARVEDGQLAASQSGAGDDARSASDDQSGRDPQGSSKAGDESELSPTVVNLPGAARSRVR
ncbi:MAG: integration host factor subunit beta [Planctomycetes bacterium]|nr:integration host factor subunit beta [Planctomycetota bacterium]